VTLKVVDSNCVGLTVSCWWTVTTTSANAFVFLKIIVRTWQIDSADAIGIRTARHAACRASEREPNNVCVSVVDRSSSSMHRRSFTCHQCQRQQQQSTVTSHAAPVSALIITVIRVTRSRRVSSTHRSRASRLQWPIESAVWTVKTRRVDALQLNKRCHSAYYPVTAPTASALQLNGIWVKNIFYSNLLRKNSVCFFIFGWTLAKSWLCRQNDISLATSSSFAIKFQFARDSSIQLKNWNSIDSPLLDAQTYP